MVWLIGVMAAAVLGIIGVGVLLEVGRDGRIARQGRIARAALAANVALFVAALFGLLLLGAQEVMAQAPAAAPREVTVGLGLALIGIGLPTALAAIAAAIALGPVGAAALAVLAEKPEMFGRTLVYLGLAEGIAIYGLVMSILMLEKV